MAVYAVADLHGRLDLFRQIQTFLNDSDKLYVIGDVIDRGPEPWKLLKAVLKDPRCTLMKGNHEDMCYYGMKEILHGDYFGDYGSVWFRNGGDVTFSKLIEDENFTAFLPVLKGLILEINYTNQDGTKIILNHSGFYTPSKEKPSADDLIWDRKQYKNYFNHDWDGPEDVIIVHGHTPIPLIVKEYEKMKKIATHPENFKPFDYEDGALWYADNHKVNIDTGAVWTNQTVVLDLDTFDEHIFYGGVNNG